MCIIKTYQGAPSPMAFTQKKKKKFPSKTLIFSHLVICHFLPDFCDTWILLDGRVKDAYDLKKAIQEIMSLPSCSRFHITSIMAF